MHDLIYVCQEHLCQVLIGRRKYREKRGASSLMGALEQEVQSQRSSPRLQVGGSGCQGSLS